MPHLELEVVINIKVFFVNFAYLPIVMLLVSIVTLHSIRVGGYTATVQQHRRRVEVIIVSHVWIVRLSDGRSIL